MDMKNKLLITFFLSVIFIGIIFSIAVIASQPHTSFELVPVPGWVAISITEHMVGKSIPNMVGADECGGGVEGEAQRGRIWDGYIYNTDQNKWEYVLGNDDKYTKKGDEITVFDDTMVGKTLWLNVKGNGPCIIPCGLDGCLDGTSAPETGTCPTSESPNNCVEQESYGVKWQCGGELTVLDDSCSEDGSTLLKWISSGNSELHGTCMLGGIMSECYQPSVKEECGEDKICSDGDCIPKTTVCNSCGTNYEWFVGGGCGSGSCSDDKLPMYKACAAGCQPLDNSCQYHFDCSSIKPSSFIAHEDGSVSLIVDTYEDRFCRIVTGSSYDNLDGGDFNGMIPKIGCKNIDDKGYHMFTLNDRGKYATIPLTKRHQCKMSNVAKDTKMRIGCVNGAFKKEFAFLKFGNSEDFEKIDLEVTEDLNIAGTMELEDLVSKTSVGIGSSDLPELRITIVKGNGAVGREGGSDRKLIWETDRKTLCHVKDSPGSPPGGNVADSGELRFSYEVNLPYVSPPYTDERITYIICKDEYDNKIIHPHIIDQIGPEIDRLQVTSDVLQSTLDVADGKGNYEITIKWRELADASGIKQYQVRGRKDNIFPNSWHYTDVINLDCDDALQPAGLGAIHECVATKELDRDSTYYFGVRAEDNVGNIGELFKRIVETVPSSCADACKVSGIDSSDDRDESNCVDDNVVIPGSFDDVSEGKVCCCLK